MVTSLLADCPAVEAEKENIASINLHLSRAMGQYRIESSLVKRLKAIGMWEGKRREEKRRVESLCWKRRSASGCVS
jgi:hypothetical protein